MDADRLAGEASLPRTPDFPPSAGSVRGIRDNNPGNLRPGPDKWLGEIEPDGNYCRFATMGDGIRALAKNLLAAQEKHACCTIDAIVTRWAPPIENNTKAYIDAVEKDTGFPHDAFLHLRERTVLAAMSDAVIHHENGVRLDRDLILRNVDRALT